MCFGVPFIWLRILETRQGASKPWRTLPWRLGTTELGEPQSWSCWKGRSFARIFLGGCFEVFWFENKPSFFSMHYYVANGGLFWMIPSYSSGVSTLRGSDGGHGVGWMLIAVIFPSLLKASRRNNRNYNKTIAFLKRKNQFRHFTWVFWIPKTLAVSLLKWDRSGSIFYLPYACWFQMNLIIHP